MKSSSKIILYIVCLIVGFVFVTVGLVNIINPGVRYADYTDNEIREKARELGMIDLKEHIEANAELNKKLSEGNERINYEIESYNENENTMDNNEDDTKIFSEELQDENSKEENMDKAKELQDYIVFKINKGESSDSVIDRLHEKGIIEDEEKFIEAVRKRGVGRNIIYGKFKLYFGMDDNNIIDILVGKE